MRIQLVHKQALLLASSVLIAVLAMGALSAWNLRNGFSDYLATRDVERLAQFAQLVSETAENAGGIAAMQSDGIGLPELLHRFGRVNGSSSMRAVKDAIPDSKLKDFLGPPPPRQPIDSIDAFKDRVAIYGLDGQPLLGRGLLKEAHDTIDQPVVVNQQTVATVRMAKLKPVPNEVEFRFLNMQYQSMVVVASVLLLTALIAALRISRHWVRPLIEIERATEQIAKGEFDTRLNAKRSDEIGDAMRNINQMAISLEKLEGARRQWLADMSHELRTPLTVLRGEIDAQIDGIIQQTPESLQSLREEVFKLNTLVDDLHLLAMADLRALPCYFEAVDAVLLIRGIVQRFNLRASQVGLTLSLELPAEYPLLVRWDAKRIEQLVSNLLDNSLRHTDAPGWVVIELKLTEPDKVQLMVEDTAPSVPVDDLPRVFEPLFRADTSRVRSTGGSGLGLAICMQIVKAHHGELHAAISAMGGMQFRLELPVDGDHA